MSTPNNVATPLPPRNPSQTGIEVADHRARGGERPRRLAESRWASKHGRRRLEAVEDQSQRSEPLASGAQHVGRADIARPIVAQVALAARAASASARTGSTRTNSRAPRRTASRGSWRAVVANPSSGRNLRLRRSPRHSKRPLNPDAPILFFDSGVGGLSVLARPGRCCPMRRSSMPPTAPASPTAGEARRSSPAACRRCSAAWSNDSTRASSVIACNTASTIALDHAARRARPADGRHRARDQARGGDVEEPGDRRARDRSDRAPALCRRPRRQIRRRLHHHPPRLARAGRACRGQARRRGGQRRRRQGGGAADVRRSRTAIASTPSSSPAPTSPCSATSCAPPSPMSPMSTAAPESPVASLI